MAKKSGKRGSVSKKTEESFDSDSQKSSNVQKMLIENFVSFQNVLVDVSSKLNNLTDQISKLLELFEESAKAFMEKDLKFVGGGSDKDLSGKIDRLLEQNKIIARGITLLHESSPAQQPQPMPAQQMQPPQQAQPFTKDPGGINRYQRSISSNYENARS
ncbi:MAG: hypothetical protein M1165_01750 [Candidatus Pacearchaeota archaeon]|nr:hypothetical protein [Candidatus Pacearchaeota archaeon]